MENYKNYIKKAVQLMRPYIPGEDLTGISVSPEDTPEAGGMIAINPKNPNDKWYVAKDFFQENYVKADNLFIHRISPQQHDQLEQFESELIEQPKPITFEYLEVSKMTKVYTIREAIEELDAIRMDSSRIVSQIASQQGKELAALVSELASITGWLARHLDHLESEILIPEIEDEVDNP
jgi:hypothetical protein